MEALAAAAISVVGPYIARGAEAFAQEAGNRPSPPPGPSPTGFRSGGPKDPVAAAAADNLATDPQEYSTTPGNLLASDLAKDETFAAELERLVDNVPHIEVVQRIEIGNGVTGADIDELVRGTVRVEQDMKEAHDVTGFRAKRVGG